MKQFGVLILIIGLLILGDKCSAQSQFSPILTKMENSLFGVDYTNQSDVARLKRIEEVVYGNSFSDSIPQRIDKLSKDLSVDVIDQKIKPTRDTFAEDDEKPHENIPKADSSVNYPIVNELEKSVFNKEFKTTEITQRLSNLEQKIFKKTYNDDLNSRVERLKAAVMPNRMANNSITEEYDGDNDLIPVGPAAQLPHQQDNYYNDSDDLDIPNANSQLPSYNTQNSVLDNYQGNSDIVIPLSALERKVFRKSYPDDTVSNRLTRLELNIFHSAFTDDDEQTRLDRISSAYQAQKTSKKYDSNKFAQHSATAMQIGAVLLLILAAIL